MERVTYEGKQGWMDSNNMFYPKEGYEEVTYEGKKGLLDNKTQEFFSDSVAEPAPSTQPDNSILSKLGKRVSEIGNIYHNTQSPATTSYLRGVINAPGSALMTLGQIGGAIGDVAGEVIPWAIKNQPAVSSMRSIYNIMPEDKRAMVDEKVGKTMRSIADPIAGTIGELEERYPIGMRMAGDMFNASTVIPTGMVTKPLAKATSNIVSMPINAGRNRVAKSLYESAMKIPPSVPNDIRSAMVKTGLENKFPVSEGGLNKLRSTIDVVNKDIDTAIQAGTQAGSRIDMNSAVSRIEQLKDYYKDYPRAEKYLDDLDGIKNEVLYKKEIMSDGSIQMVEKYPDGVPLNQAQRMKQRIYQINRKHYGDMKRVDIEADKAIARGLKEEIVTQYPDIAKLNAKDSSLIQLDEFLERAVNRSRNYDTIRLGDQILSVGGAVIGGPSGGIAAGMAKHIWESPVFKSKLAIALNKAKKVK